MLISLGAILSSALVSLLVTPAAGRLARALKIMDYPGDLKVHDRATPYLGGVAILLGIWAGVACVLLLGRPPEASSTLLAGFVSACAIVAVAGLLDDLGRIGVGAKLAGQVFCGGILLASGFQLGVLSWKPLDLVLSLLYVVGACNAMNLFDGLDGLAAGVAGIVGLFGVLLAQLCAATLPSLLCLSIAGGAAGFLFHNFPPARIFMGDMGSLLLGLALAAAGMEITHASSDPRWFLAPIVVMGLPLMDTLAAFLRRVIHRRRFTEGDRYHFYDLLKDDFGFNPRQIALLAYGISIFLGVCGVAVVIVPSPLPVLIAGSLVLGFGWAGWKMRILSRGEHP